MPVVINFLLFLLVAIVGVIVGFILSKDFEAKADEKSCIGAIILHIDEGELVATSLEMKKAIFYKDDGAIVRMKVKFRKYDEMNNGSNEAIKH